MLDTFGITVEETTLPHTVHFFSILPFLVVVAFVVTLLFLQPVNKALILFVFAYCAAQELQVDLITKFLLQSANASAPILPTLAGIVMLFKLLQFSKAQSPITFTVLGKTTLLSDCALSNA